VGADKGERVAGETELRRATRQRVLAIWKQVPKEVLDDSPARSRALRGIEIERGWLATPSRRALA
jgi:hypothetical protein